MGSDGANAHLLTCVDEVAGQCEVCRALDGAPHAPVAETSAVAMFREKLQADLLFVYDITTVRVMEVFSTYSHLLPVRAKNPHEVWGASCSSWIGVFGPPARIQMDEGGDWKNASRTDLLSESRIKLLVQGVGARPWIFERQNGLARGGYNRLKGDDRFSRRRILAEVRGNRSFRILY